MRGGAGHQWTARCRASNIYRLRTARGIQAGAWMWASRMNSELPVSADALLAERARLEEELQSSEDWCELLRLKSRKDRGEGMSAVNAARLEMVLIDALAQDETFVRYKAVCVALERLIRGLPPLPAQRSKAETAHDDLTEIDGISASMARRLNALDVTSFMQIAEWTNADIKQISADLGIGRQIFEQDWIGQAEELATRADTPSAPAPKPQLATVRPTPPAQRVEAREPPLQKPVPPAPVREDVRKFESAKSEQPPAPPIAARPPEVKSQSSEPSRSISEKAVTPQAATPVAKNSEPAGKSAGSDGSTADIKKPSVEPSGPSPIVTLQNRLENLTPSSEPNSAANASASKPALTAPATAAPSDNMTRPLPMPPRPLRIDAALVPASPPAPSQSVPPGGAAAVAAPLATGSTSATPPRPLVITRASLPKIEVAAAPPALAPSSTAPPAKAHAAAPPAAAPTVAARPPASPVAASASSAPAMSIDEAIAYAAEVARQGPRAPVQAKIEPRRDAPPSNTANTAVARPSEVPASKPSPPSAPVQQQKAAPAAAPAMPPPLPADFVPPPEAAAEPDGLEYRSASVQNSRMNERDDHANYRSNAEEATVEIVLKSALEVRSTPRMALTKVATEKATNVPRPATPIGRFLKALTGN